MELYILDDNLRRIEVVEQFETLVWTERWSSQGDFVLDIDPSLAETQLFTQGTMLAIDKSDRVMATDTAENSVNADGNRVYKVTGPSLEHVMEDRPNKYTEFGSGAGISTQLALGDGTTLTPNTIMWNLFHDICIVNPTFALDQLPFIQNGVNSSVVGSIAMPTEFPLIRTDVDTLYNTIKNIADTYRLGFRLIRVEDLNPANPVKLFFEVYTGFDRTTGQTARPSVVFSTEMDNLADTSDFLSTAGLKNVAYVFHSAASRVVWAENTLTSTTGFNKRVLIVDATDITGLSGTPLNNALDQRGKEELAKHRILIGFDGQIPQSSNLVYGTDYKLGDLVEKRSDTGNRTIMRVMEQIFTSDKEGEKSFPTLVLDSIVVAGAWDAVAPNRTWDSYTTETWDSM